MAKAGKPGMGHGTNVGHPHVGVVDDRLPEQEDLAEQLQGNNQMHGDDQNRVHNERHRMADEQNEPPDTPDFIERHKTGLRSDKLAPTEAELDKITRKP